MNKVLYSSFLRDLLRNKRTNLNITQEELSNKLKKPQSYVSKYESGERRLDLFDLKQICEALNINIIDLIKEIEKGTKNEG